MTELLAEFIMTLDKSRNYSSREFLKRCGQWLDKKNINSIVATAARNEIPVFCPAIADSPYGDAALIAESRGHHLMIDAIQDYVEFMSMGESVIDTGVGLHRRRSAERLYSAFRRHGRPSLRRQEDSGKSSRA